MSTSTMKTILAVAMFALASVAIGSPKVPIIPLQTMTSHQNETKIDFLVRVAHWLRAYSDKTGFEACARIARNDNQYGVVITTSKSHIGCAINNTLLPETMTATVDTIHSHGIDKRQRITNGDKFFLPAGYTSNRINFISGQNTEHFSPVDYRGGSGYLAGSKGLYYQDGNDENNLVASF